MKENDEGRLLSAAMAGDRQVAEDLVDLTYRQVYASLMKLCAGDDDLARELTQETYHKAWRSLRRFDRRSELSTWLYRIAYTTFLNHNRRPQPVSGIDESRARELPDPEPVPDQVLSRREVAIRLRRAVMELPEALRFSISARFWGELPVREIARLEGVSGTAIRKRLRRAMKRLHQELGESA